MMAIVYREDLDERVHAPVQCSSIDPLRIAISPPELEPMQRVMRGEPESATYIIQRYVASGLQERNHSLTYIAPSMNGEIFCSTDLQHPTSVQRTWSSSSWFRLLSSAVWRVQRMLHVPYLNVFANYRLYDACLQCLPGHDIVYERTGMYKYGVAKACKQLGIPYVLYIEADEVHEYDVMGTPLAGLQRWRANWALRFNMNAADRIICVSNPLRRSLIKNWGVAAEKISVFPNVADAARFCPDERARADVRDMLEIGDSPLIIFVGNFYEWHDVATLLDAFARVHSASPDVRLLLVGDGSRRQAMMARTAELGIEQAVFFTGLVSHQEVPPLLAAADIAVVPYPAMGPDIWLSPLKLYEYMASGKAIIASAVGQLTEVLTDEQTGLLVTPGDTTELEAAIQRLIVDRDLRQRLERQAREEAVRYHSWEHYLTRLEKIFAAVINRQPPCPL